MKNIILILVAVFLLVTNVASQGDQSGSVIQMISNQRYFGKMKTGGQEFYELDITDARQGFTLLVLVRSFEPHSDPNLYISTIDQRPSKENQEISCDSNGMDICAIKYEFLKDKQKIYIAVSCTEYCSYNLRVSYTDVAYNQRFSLGNQLAIEFNRGQPAIVVMNIPNDMNLSDIDRVIIETELLNPQDVRSGISIYMNYGESVPDTNKYDIKGTQIWNNGLGIIIQHDKLCKNCNYTFNILGWHRALVNIKTESFSKVRDIRVYEWVNDAILTKGSRTYQFTFDENDYISANSSLAFTLSPYSGDPDIYVHPEKLPVKFQDYRWNSKELARQQLIVTPSMFKEAGYQNWKTVYITIESLYFSSYTLSVYPVDSSQNFINPGTPYQGFVSQNELVTFQLFLSGNNYTVDISLRNDIGNPDIFLKKCTDENNCTISMQEINRVYKGEKPKSLMAWSINENSKDQISFVHSSNGCDVGFFIEPVIGEDNQSNIVPNDFRSCTYLIGVYGNMPSHQQSQFTLLVQRENQVQRMLEGHLIQGAIELGEQRFFSMHLVDNCDNPRIQSVQFVGTSQYGKIQLYTSFSETFPDESKHDQSSNSDPYIIYNKDSTYKCLGQTFYISIKGISAASFTISTIVQRLSDDNKSTKSYLELFDNTPQGFYITKEQNFFFMIKVPINYVNGVFLKPNIYLGWWAWWSSFDIYIVGNKNGDPSPSNWDFSVSSDNRQFMIRGEDPSYSDNGVFKGVIVPQNEFSGRPMINGRLHYYIQGSILNVFMGDSNTFELLPEQKLHLSVEVRTDQDLQITTKIANLFNSDLIAYGNIFNKTNFRPNAEYFQFTWEGSQGYRLDSDWLLFSCKGENQQSENPDVNIPCYAYITLQSMSEKPLNVTVLIRGKNHAQYLFDSFSVEVLSPLKKEEFQNFRYDYFPASENIDSVTITLYSLYDTLDLFVDIFDSFQSDIDQSETLPYPNSQQYFKKSISYNYMTFNSLTIKKQDISDRCPNIQDGAACVFLISVGLNKERDNLDTFNTTSFTISVFGQSLLVLEPGIAIWDYVPEKAFKYYQFYIPDDQTNIIVSVTPLDDGDPDLMVAFGEESRPTGTNGSDWFSSFYQADMVMIQPKSNDKIQNSMKGWYVVGVFGSANSTFQLTFTKGGQMDYFKVFENSPYDFDINQKGILYLEYLHFSDENFKILLNQDFGQAYINVNVKKEDQDLLARLPNDYLNSDWSNYQTSGGDYLLIKKTDPHYRDYSVYLIGIRAITKSQVQILITKENDYVLLQNNKVLQDLTMEKQSNHYHYFSNNNFTVYVQVFSGSLDLYVTQGYDLDDRKAALYKYMNAGVGLGQLNSPQIEVTASTNQISGDSPFVYNQAFSILVDGQQQGTQYSIQVVSDSKNNTMRSLKFGVPVDGKLRIGQSADYSFTLRGSGFLEDKISIIFNMLNMHNTPNYYKVAPQIDFFIRREKNASFSRIQPETYVHSSASFLYQFTALSGEFLISLKHNDSLLASIKKDLEYRILISDMSLGIITPNTEVLNVIKLNSVNKFQMFLPKDSQVLVEAFQCSGNVRIQASRDYSRVVDNQFDIEVAQLEKYHHYAVIENPDYADNQNIIYFGVRGSYIQKKDQNILYQIKTRVYPLATEIPYQMFSSGNGGLLKWQRDSLLQVLNVTFDTLACYQDQYCSQNSRSNLNPLIFSYKLILSTNEARLLQGSRCEHYPNSTEVDTELYLENMIVRTPELHFFDSELAFMVPENSLEQYLQKTIYYTVVAQMVLNDQNNNQERFTFFYNPGVIENYKNDPNFNDGDQDHQKNNSHSWFISIAIILLLSLTIGLIIIFRQYQQIETKLNYEMQDVRAIAGQAASEIKEPGYQGFADV